MSNLARGSSKGKTMLECTFSVSSLIRLSGVGHGSVIFLLQTGCAYVARASFELKVLLPQPFEC